MLGVTPALGRMIVPSDDTPGAAREVAVLSHGFWSRRFGGDPAVIGRTLTMGRRTFEIVGVTREGFTGIEPGISTGLWVPLTSAMTPESLTDPGWHWFKVMGRLASGQAADEVRELDAGRADEPPTRAGRVGGRAPRASGNASSARSCS